MKKVIVAGGGAAGMIAAIFAARGGSQVILIDKNEKLGKKIFITGKGRCNLTNACETEDLLQHVIRNPKFLYSSIYGFGNQEVMNFFEELGCHLKIERGERVFPASDKSSDVISALEKECKKQGVEIRKNQKIKGLILKDGICIGVQTEVEEKADAVIVATGGLAYPSTGSTGDGYNFAKQAGHTIMPLSPSLVPMETLGGEAKEMQGLALKNIEVSFFIEGKGKCIYKDFGEMLFTHFGVSGPVILSASSYLQGKIGNEKMNLFVDFKPALSIEQLDARILRDFEENKNAEFKNALRKLLPRTAVPVIVRRSGISPEKQVNLVTKEERRKLAECIKGLAFQIKGFRDWNEAIITKGGIKVSEINPSTMESKKCRNLFFAGEVLDVDALTGGFNLQIAWSTGAAAGIAVNTGGYEDEF